MSGIAIEQRKELFARIMDAIAPYTEKYPQQQLTGFIGRKGILAHENTELVVVGRAVNERDNSFLAKSFLDGNQRENILDAIIKDAYPHNTCPMAWICEQWKQNGDDYNTKRSAFWRVIYDVLLHEIPAASPLQRASYIAWTNLYKIAPVGSNPSEKLCELQMEACVKLLHFEIHEWKPRRLLFLTGLGWAKPFLESMNISYQKTVDNLYVEATASLPYSIVVAKHPQGKNEVKWNEEVISAFKRLKAY
jgi:hypothetical protein